MAAGRNIRAGGAFVELMTKDSAFLRGLDRAARRFQTFGLSVAKIGATISTAMAGLTAATIGALVPFAHFSDVYQNLINRVSATNDEAAASTTVLSQTINDLFNIAKRSRTPIEGLVDLYARMSLSAKSAGLNQRGLLKIVETVGKAISIGGGTEESTNAAIVQFSQIMSAGGAARGIGQELNSIREQAPFLFRIMAEGLQRIGVSASGTSAEMRKLAEDGKLTSEQITKAVLAMGGDVEERFARISPTITSAFIVLRNNLIKTFGELSQKTGFGAAIAGLVFDLSDAISELARRAAPIITSFADWMKANRQLVRTLARVAGGIFVAAGALTAIGLAIAGASLGFGGFVKLISGTKFLIGAMLSPLGLAVTGFVLWSGAVAAASVAFLKFTKTGQTATSFLTNKFAQFKNFVLGVFADIGKALSRGDIELAGRILWAGLRVAWLEGTMKLRQIWIQFSGDFVKTIYAALAAIQTGWTLMTNALSVGWIETVNFLGHVWDTFSTQMVRGFYSAVNLISKAWNKLKGFVDSSFDVDAANKAADMFLAQVNQVQTSGQVKRFIERENERQQAIRAQEDKFNSELMSILMLFEKTAKIIDEKTAKELAEAREELARMRQELINLQRQANLFGPGGPFEGATASGGPRPKIEEVSDALGKIADSFTSRGSFNPFGVSQMGAGTAAERTAKATEETAKNTERIYTNMKNPGSMIFGM